MPRTTTVFIVLWAVTIAACSSEDVKRTTYETLQNVADQQCDKDMTSECPERQSYDEYRHSQQNAQ